MNSINWVDYKHILDNTIEYLYTDKRILIYSDLDNFLGLSYSSHYRSNYYLSNLRLDIPESKKDSLMYYDQAHLLLNILLKYNDKEYHTYQRDIYTNDTIQEYCIFTLIQSDIDIYNEEIISKLNYTLPIKQKIKVFLK